MYVNGLLVAPLPSLPRPFTRQRRGVLRVGRAGDVRVLGNLLPDVEGRVVPCIIDIFLVRVQAAVLPHVRGGEDFDAPPKTSGI